MDSLKELGLTEYEARVYLSTISEGSMQLRELAFRSGVPRTKVYSTVRSLSKKGLLRLRERPLRCSAVDVEEVFDSTIRQEERRLKGLKGSLAKIRKIRQMGMRGQSLAEGRYYIYVAHEALAKLAELIEQTQYSFHALVDAHGLEMLRSCKKQLASLSMAETEVRILISDRETEALKEHLDLPFPARVGHVMEGRNLFLIDRSTALIGNSSTGNGMLISVADVATLIDSNIFLPCWEKGLELSRYVRMANLSLAEELPALRGDGRIIEQLIESALSILTDEQLRELSVEIFQRVASSIPSQIFTLPPDAALPAFAELVELSLDGRGSVRYDGVTRLMTFEIQGRRGRLPPSAWLLAFMGYLESHSMPLRIINVVESEKETIFQAKVTWNLLA
jgi:sugar-specific transcriptional regulator TrmB